MKKVLLIICLYSTAIANAQTCSEIEGFMPIALKFGINVYGFPETRIPTVPLYWNRFYKVDE